MSDPQPAQNLPDHSPAAAPPGALAIILFIVFLDLMGFGIILPQLPFYAVRYQVSAVWVTLLFSIFSACQFVAAPVLGIIGDRHGRRPVLVFSQLGSAIGYAMLGVVTQINLPNVRLALALIYLARIIDGISGGNISTAQAYISDVTTDKNRTKGMGLLGAAFGIGFAAGPALGGLVGNDTNRVAWPAFLAAIFSLVAMILSWAWLPESRSHTPVGDEVWLHPSRLLPILRRGTLVQLLMISFVAMVAFTMMEGIIALFMHDKFTYGPDHIPFGMRQVGWYFGYLGVFIIVVQGGLIGRLTSRFGEWSIAILGALTVSIGMSLYMWIGMMPMLWLLLVAGAANAVGRSLQQPPIASLISKHSDRNEQGVVFGLYHSLGSLARVIGPLAAGLLYLPLHHTAPFLAAGIIMVIVAVWLTMLHLTVATQPQTGEIPPLSVAQAAAETT